MADEVMTKALSAFFAPCEDVTVRNYDSICLYDFAGNDREPGCWCDYYIPENIVVFGGAWYNIPNMPSETEPSEKAVAKWVTDHGGEYFPQ